MSPANNPSVMSPVSVTIVDPPTFVPIRLKEKVLVCPVFQLMILVPEQGSNGFRQEASVTTKELFCMAEVSAGTLSDLHGL